MTNQRSEKDTSGKWTPSYHNNESDSDDDEQRPPPLLKRNRDSNDSEDGSSMPSSQSSIFMVHRPQGAYADEMRAAVSGIEQDQEDGHNH